jgi:hypothetical protein
MQTMMVVALVGLTAVMIILAVVLGSVAKDLKRLNDSVQRINDITITHRYCIDSHSESLERYRLRIRDIVTYLDWKLEGAPLPVQPPVEKPKLPKGL